MGGFKLALLEALSLGELVELVYVVVGHGDDEVLLRLVCSALVGPGLNELALGFARGGAEVEAAVVGVGLEAGVHVLVGEG